jgi:transcriptional regulator with XRE-family HTH domain
MTPEDLAAARAALGLTAAALGRALELEGRDPGQQVLRWESGKAAIPGPARVAVRYMLAEASRMAQEAANPPPVTDAPPSRAEAVYEALRAPRTDAEPKATRRRG